MVVRQVLSLALFLPLAAVAQADAVKLNETGRRATSPEITVGPDGSVVAIWLDRGLTADRPAPKPHKPGEHSHRSSTDLYLTRSVDAGRTWSKPVRVNDEPGSVWGFAVSKPRVAIGKTGTIHLFFPGNERSPVTGLDVVTARYTRSTDAGRTFEKARTINRPADFDKTGMLGEGLSATFSFGTMGLAPDGTVVAAWQDIGGMTGNADGADAHMATSTDDGRTFSAERAVIPSDAVCPCCQLTVAFGGSEAFIGYRKLYADGRDSTVARVTTGNGVLAGETRLPFAPWKIDGCPLKPTDLAVDGDRVYAASYTAGENPPGVYFTRSADRGQSFTGRIAVHPGAPYSDAPELTVDRNGQVRIVWQAKTGGPRRLFTATSTDHGATLSAPVEIATPAGNSAFPASAVAPDGAVFVVWEQENEEVFVTRLDPTAAAVAAN
ncbi:MAG: exo-alpha-sialidase [Gammaproteobacteria bacterium]|nr:exo-alpha-sialidase [Gammaproteobacteria bacterium]